MDTETNWHRITAALLRENERLQTQLDLITHQYEALQLAASAIIADTAQDEDYQPSETDAGLYWTDGEYATDDALESASEVEGELEARVIPVLAADGAIIGLPKEVGQLEVVHAEEDEDDEEGDEDYAPSETQTEQYWTDKEFITDDAWETDSADSATAEQTQPATPEPIGSNQPDLFATPSTIGFGLLTAGESPDCSTRARHRSQGTPSRFVPRETRRKAFSEVLRG